MSHEVVEVHLADLLLDAQNARLSSEQASQQATALALAEQQGSRIVRLAEDIVRSGLDPTTLPAVVATGDQRKRYKVLEGNRRVLAVKALETPALINTALSAADQKRLNRLSDEYDQDPVDLITCILFDSEAEAYHWIELRHTGQNEGVGLVEWDSNQKDRFAARHGTRSPEGQVIDFVEKVGVVQDYPAGSKGIITTLKRLLSTPDVRNALGVEMVDGTVYSHYPVEEVSKSLGYVVDDLRSGGTNVGSVYTADQRRDYASRLPRAARPKKSARLNQPVALDDLSSGEDVHGPPPKKQVRKRKPKPARTSLIPRSCDLDIDPPRINAIYTELLSLNLEEYPNAGAVAFRVLVELSVDHYLKAHNLMSEGDRRNTPLAKRMKSAGAHLREVGAIDQQIETAVKRAADGNQLLDASTVVMNQYVHNPHVIPKPTELRSGWDELQPFMESIWPT